MKDKIREIEEIVINNKMSAQQKIRAIYQATRLEIEKSYAKGLEDGRKI